MVLHLWRLRIQVSRSNSYRYAHRLFFMSVIMCVVLLSGCTTQDSNFEAQIEQYKGSKETLAEYAVDKNVAAEMQDDVVKALSYNGISESLKHCIKLYSSTSSMADKDSYTLFEKLANGDNGKALHRKLGGKWPFKCPAVICSDCFTSVGSTSTTQFIVIAGDKYRMTCMVMWHNRSIISYSRKCYEYR